MPCDCPATCLAVDAPALIDKVCVALAALFACSVGARDAAVPPGPHQQRMCCFLHCAMQPARR